MPKPLYDNMEDARTKLNATLCMYNDRAIQIKEVAPDDDGQPRHLLIRAPRNLAINTIDIDDPDFNCTRFNIGYVNNDGCATWWARRPLRQYRQGLRYDQMVEFSPHPGYKGRMKFDFTTPVLAMMENSYPTFETCEQKLKDKIVLNIAFARDFAASWDDIHDDMLIEYKAKKIGMSHKFKKFKLLKEYEYLQETLAEIANVHG